MLVVLFHMKSVASLSLVNCGMFILTLGDLVLLLPISAVRCGALPCRQCAATHSPHSWLPLQANSFCESDFKMLPSPPCRL